uniref:Uncharacterized protein n=1 Tax=Proboscia inermis TaxID=420281 RepID=A0A7S0CCZ4_9STRA
MKVEKEDDEIKMAERSICISNILEYKKTTELSGGEDDIQQQDTFLHVSIELISLHNFPSLRNILCNSNTNLSVRFELSLPKGWSCLGSNQQSLYGSTHLSRPVYQSSPTNNLVWDSKGWKTFAILMVAVS